MSALYYRLRAGFPVMVLATIILLAFARVWSAGWVYDDANWLPAGPFILATAPFAAAAWIGGGLPWAFHALVVCLHLLNGLLLWTVTDAWLSHDARTLVLTLFWLHPLQVESVAYVSGGLEVLLTFYVLAAWWASQQRRAWWIVSLAALWLGARLKYSALPILVVIPGAIVAARRARPSMVAVLMGVAGCLALVAAQPALLGYVRSGGWSARLQGATTLAQACWRYLAFIVVPSGLSIEHDWASVPPVVGILALVAAIAVGVIAWLRRQDWPALGWAWLWIAGLLAPRALTLPAAPPLTEHHTLLPFLAIWLLIGAAWDRCVVHVPQQESIYA